MQSWLTKTTLITFLLMGALSLFESLFSWVLLVTVPLTVYGFSNRLNPNSLICKKSQLFHNGQPYLKSVRHSCGKNRVDASLIDIASQTIKNILPPPFSGHFQLMPVSNIDFAPTTPPRRPFDEGI